jgi:Domain of unknown function (DUF4384)
VRRAIRTQHWCSALTMALAALAYASAGAASTRPPPRTIVSLFTTVRTARGQTGQIRDGAVLHSNDQIDFVIRVTQASYVHLIDVSPDGSAARLYPEAGSAGLLQPGRDYRVPVEAGSSFQLNATVGTERFFLVATRLPIGRSPAALAALVRTVDETKRWPKRPPEDRRGRSLDISETTDPNPGALYPNAFPRGLYEGIVLDARRAGATLSLEADADGNVVGALTVKHLP